MPRKVTVRDPSPEVATHVIDESKIIREKKLKFGEKYTLVERRVHRRLIASLYVQGQSARQIQSVLSKGDPTATPPIPPMSLSLTYVTRAISRVVSEWEVETSKDQQIGGGKNGQVRRLFSHLSKSLRAESPAWKDVVAIEREIAKLQGNYAPTKVSVESVQTVALRAVILDMTPEQLVAAHDEALSEEHELNRLRDVVKKNPQLTFGERH